MWPPGIDLDMLPRENDRLRQRYDEQTMGTPAVKDVQFRTRSNRNIPDWVRTNKTARKNDATFRYSVL
jgi:hypothetical protein